MWDVRDMSAPVESVVLTDGAKENPSVLGGVSVEWMQEAGPTKYLVGTPNQSIEYSPEIERDFEEKYKQIAKHPDNACVDVKQIKNPVVTFTDASFGVTYKEMRSISGVVIYVYGTPVAWSSKVQSVFASSTTESEWVAMSDGCAISESVFQLHKFLLGRETKPGPLICDNRAATLSARERDITDISKKTRHIALKFTRVLQERDRVWFCPTDEQKADALTKSSNQAALKMIFSHKQSEAKVWKNYDNMNNEEEFDNSESDSWVDAYFAKFDARNTRTFSSAWENVFVSYCAAYENNI